MGPNTGGPRQGALVKAIIWEHFFKVSTHLSFLDNVDDKPPWWWTESHEEKQHQEETWVEGVTLRAGRLGERVVENGHVQEGLARCLQRHQGIIQ